MDTPKSTSSNHDSSDKEKDVMKLQRVNSIILRSSLRSSGTISKAPSPVSNSPTNRAKDEVVEVNVYPSSSLDSPRFPKPALKSSPNFNTETKRKKFTQFRETLEEKLKEEVTEKEENDEKEEKVVNSYKELERRKRNVSHDDLAEILLNQQSSHRKVSSQRFMTFLKDYISENNTIGEQELRHLYHCSKNLAVIEAGEAILSKFFQSYKELPSSVEESMVFKKLQRKDILFSEDEKPEGWYVVLEGRLRIFRYHNVVQILDELKAGAVIGILGYFLEGYPYSCCAVEPTTIIFIPMNIIREFMKEPEFLSRAIKATLMDVKRFDEVTLYHNLFGLQSPAQIPSIPHRDIQEESILSWPTREILSLHLDIKSLSEELIEKFEKGVNVVYFQKGNKVFTKFSSPTCAYIILSGVIHYIVERGQEKIVVQEKKVGSGLGFTSILCGTGISASAAIAAVNTVLLQIPQHLFELLIHHSRETIESMVKKRAEEAIKRIKKFELSYRYLYVSRGNSLVTRLDKPSSIFVVLTGCFVEEKARKKKVVNYYSPGEVIGVKELINGSYKTNISAIRNSEVVVFDMNSDQLLKLLPNRPEVLSDLLAKEKLKSPPSLGSTIAFLFNKNIDQEKFFKDFVPAIQKIGNTAILNVEKVIALFGLTSSDVPPLLSLDYYANDLAISHEFVIFCGNWDCPNWTERILEQSNLVVIVESRDSPAHPLPNNIVNLIKSAGKIHLALLYDSCPKNYFSTSQWLKENRYPFSFEFAHNIVTSRKEDFGRLARILTGNAIGLVLGGGSCKGLAHIGVIKVLKEHGIPIDVIGGTSAGAIISCLYSSGKTLRKMTSIFVKVFTLSNWLTDFTFPFMSYLSGKAVRDTIVSIFPQNICLEDLSIPTFAISTNMDSFKEHVHKTGPVWLAIRSSISLPPFLPPVKTADSLLMDGGFVNNVPVDVGRNLSCKHIIAVNLAPKPTFRLIFPENYDNSKSGFHILYEKFFHQREYPSILTILTNLAYIVNQNLEPSLSADIFIEPPNMFEFGTFTTPEQSSVIIERGYEEAKKQLANFRVTQPEKYEQLSLASPVDEKDPSLQTNLTFGVVMTSPPFLFKRKLKMMLYFSGFLIFVGASTYLLSLKIRYGPLISIRQKIQQFFAKILSLKYFDRK